MGAQLGGGFGCGALVLGCGGLLLYKRKAGAVEDVPKKMRRIVLQEPNSDIKLSKLALEEVDVPKLESGQILVKVDAAPINPSDDGIWKSTELGPYCPFPIGIEGSGKVIASGGGLAASRLLGKNVAIVGPKTYAEYAIVNAFSEAYKLPDQIPVENACSFFINPFTVVGIVDTVRQTGGKVFILTAAASQMGQMMVKYCEQEGMIVVNVVRRKEQVDLLKNLGAKYIVDTSDAEWKSKLQEMISGFGIYHAFDCIAGNMSGELLTMLPPGGSLWVYGRLSGQTLSGVLPVDLMYRQKKLQGWLLTTWISQGGTISALRRTMRSWNVVKKYWDAIFASNFKDTTLANMHKDYLALQAAGHTGTKLRVRPHAL